MMLMLEEVVRISADRVRCRILREGTPFEFTVRFAQLDEGIRGLDYEGMSPRDAHELSNSDEFKALARTLWAYVDGATVTLPLRIDADLAE